MWIVCNPRELAAASACLNSTSTLAGLAVGLTSTAMTVVVGTSSRSTSTRFGVISVHLSAGRTIVCSICRRSGRKAWVRPELFWLGLPSFGCAEDSTSARAAAVRKFSSVDVRLGQEATFHTSFAAHRQAQCGMRSNFGIDLTSLTHGCCEQTNICLRGTNSFRWRRAPRRKL